MSGAASSKALYVCNKQGIIAGAWSQGLRMSMEDVSIYQQSDDQQTTVIGICDGHAGVESAAYVAHNAAQVLLKARPDVSNQELIREWHRIDRELLESGQDNNSGSTCLMVRINADGIMLLNTGDCLAFIIDVGVMIRNVAATSADDERDDVNELGMIIHDLSHAEDLERIERAGAIVHQQRINGRVNMARAFGDMNFKMNSALPPENQAMVCTPNIYRVPPLQPGQVLVLCSDGLCPPLAPTSISGILYECREGLMKAPAQVAQALVTEAIQKRYSRDNVTVYLIQAPDAKQDGGAEESVAVTAASTPLMLPSKSANTTPLRPVPTAGVFSESERVAVLEKSKSNGYPEGMMSRIWTFLCSGSVYEQNAKRTFCRAYSSIENPFILQPEVVERIRAGLAPQPVTGMFVESDENVLKLNIYMDCYELDQNLATCVATLFPDLGQEWHYCMHNEFGISFGIRFPQENVSTSARSSAGK